MEETLSGLLIADKVEVLELIGKGGCGSVYKGYHRLLDQHVAIKVLNHDSSNSSISEERFKSEAQVLSTFSHENIVKFYAFSNLPDGRSYMLLEYLEGKTLADLLKETGYLSQERAFPIFIQVCQALVYAHERQIIHRDLKPANVMLCSSGDNQTAKLLDFGIFKAVQAGGQNLTQTGQILGSVNYMSPEQCLSKEMDERSDIYSFGCLMYEVLVGQPPMEDKTQMLIMHNHINKPIESVPCRSGISTSLEKIILTCLEKNAEKRQTNSEELLEALTKCQDKSVKKKELSNFLNSPKIVIGSRLLVTAVLIILAGMLVKDVLNNAAIYKIVSDSKSRNYIQSNRGDTPVNPKSDPDEIARVLSENSSNRVLRPGVAKTALHLAVLTHYHPKYLHAPYMNTIIQRLKEHRASLEKDRLDDSSILIALLFAQGKDDEAEKELDWLSQGRSGNIHQSTCFSNVFERSIEEKVARGDLPAENHLLMKFSKYADECKDDYVSRVMVRILSAEMKQRELVRLQSSKSADEIEQNKEAAKKLKQDAIVDLVKAQEYMDNAQNNGTKSLLHALGRLCKVAVSLDSKPEMILELSKRSPTLRQPLADDKANPDLAEIRVSNAWALLRLGKANQSLALSSKLVRQYMNSIPIMGDNYCIAAELLQLEALSWLANGTKDRTAEAKVMNEAQRFLQEILTKDKSAFLTAVWILSNDKNSHNYVQWEKISAELDQCENLRYRYRELAFKFIDAVLSKKGAEAENLAIVKMNRIYAGLKKTKSEIPAYNQLANEYRKVNLDKMAMQCEADAIELAKKKKIGD